MEIFNILTLPIIANMNKKSKNIYDCIQMINWASTDWVYPILGTRQQQRRTTLLNISFKIE